MADSPSLADPEDNPSAVQSAYVVEHYGFASGVAPARADPPRAERGSAPQGGHAPTRRSARGRRQRMLAAGALGLVLASGIGGIAAAADPGRDGGGEGGRSGVAVVQDGNGGGRGGGFHGGS